MSPAFEPIYIYFLYTILKLLREHATGAVALQASQ